MSESLDVESYLASLAGPTREVVDALVDVIEAALPHARSLVWDGHPVWSLDAPGTAPVCMVTATPAGVTLGLFRGHEVDDPSGRLVAPAGTIAHVTFRTADSVDPAVVADWLAQAVAAELFCGWLRTHAAAA